MPGGSQTLGHATLHQQRDERRHAQAGQRHQRVRAQRLCDGPRRSPEIGHHAVSDRPCAGARCVICLGFPVEGLGGLGSFHEHVVGLTLL